MHTGSVEASKGPYFDVFATFWAILGPFSDPHVNDTFKCFPKVPIRWHLFPLLLAPMRPIQGMGLLRGPVWNLFAHIEVPVYLMFSSVFPR